MAKANDNDKRDAEPKGGEAMRRAAEEAHRRVLDDPLLPDKPDEMRHLAYFLAVVGGSFVLNLVSSSSSPASGARTR